MRGKEEFTIMPLMGSKSCFQSSIKFIGNCFVPYVNPNIGLSTMMANEGHRLTHLIEIFKVNFGCSFLLGFEPYMGYKYIYEFYITLCKNLQLFH